MLFGYFTLFVALLIETVGAYYSITGLAAIFSGAVIPILIMGGVLELGKVTAAVWLKNNWERASIQFKTYLLPAVCILMLITSMGIFGFLSKAHNDQTLVSGDVQSKISIYDEKIKTARENIESDRKQLKQMDEAVDQVMARSSDEKGADKSNAIRRSQQRDRSALAKDIEANQRLIATLNDESAPIRAEVRKVEAEVGPIKYIAKLIYDDNPDANILEKAVTWMILIIVAVFDPLALVLILAAQQSIRWANGEEKVKEEKPDTDLKAWFDRARARARFWDKKQEEKPEEPSTFTSAVDNFEPVVDKVEVPEEYFSEPDTVESKEDKSLLKKQWGGFGFPMSSTFTQSETKDTSKPDPLAHIVVPEIPDDDPLHKIAKMSFMSNNPHLDEREIHAQHQTGEIDRLPWHDLEHINNLPISDSERKQLIDRFVNTPQSAPQFYEIDPLGLQADNAPQGITGEVKGFGTSFPVNPGKSDMFLRVDQLPSVLYKFNGNQWIEVDKSLSDQHAYNTAYIDHLIEKISTGEYDPELLSDAERDSIEQRLKELEQE